MSRMLQSIFERMGGKLIMGAENSITGKVMAVTDDGREFVFENAIISSITVKKK